MGKPFFVLAIILILLIVFPFVIAATSYSSRVSVNGIYNRPHPSTFTLWFTNGTILSYLLTGFQIPFENNNPWIFNYVITNDIDSPINISTTIENINVPSNIELNASCIRPSGPLVLIQPNHNETQLVKGNFYINGSYAPGSTFSYYFDVIVTSVLMSNGSTYQDSFVVYGNAEYPNLPDNMPSPTPTATPSPTPTEKPIIMPTSSPSPTPSPTPTLNPTMQPSATPTQTSTPTSSPTSNPTTEPAIQPTSNPTTSPTTTIQQTDPTLQPSIDPTTIHSAQPTSSPQIPEFTLVIPIFFALFILLPFTAIILKKFSKTRIGKVKSIASFMIITIMFFALFVSLSRAQIASTPTQAATANFSLWFTNGTTFPSSISSGTFKFGNTQLNIGGIMMSPSAFGPQYQPEVNLIVIRNDGNAPIIIHAALENVQVPANIVIGIQNYSLGSTYAPPNSQWMGYNNLATGDVVGVGQYEWLGLILPLSQTTSVPSGTPTFTFSYSFDIVVTATQA